MLLMSATINEAEYRDYFKDCRNRPPAEVNAQGRRYEVDEKYLNDIHIEIPSTFKKDFSPDVDQPEFAVAQIMVCIDILRKLDVDEKDSKVKGSVLIFLPGLAEINEVQRAIRRYCDGPGRNVIERLHSSLPRDKRTLQRIMMTPRYQTQRKIVLSTNMGESSITIADVKYIIDFCLTKYLEKDQSTNLTQLKLKWASTDMCDQRKGRAGRTQPGICYRLVKKDFFRNNLLKHIPPEIERCPLEDCVLLGKSVYPDLTPHKFLRDACAVPKGKDIDQAIKSLKELGALTLTLDRKGEPTSDQSVEEVTSDDMKDGDLTHLGRLMNLLPLNHACSRLIYLGYMLGLTYEAIIIAACMNVQNFWQYNKDVDLDNQDSDSYINAYRSRLFWARGTNSDHIAMYNSFVSWYTKMPPDYCDNYRARRHRFPQMLHRNREGRMLTDQNQEIIWTQKHGLNAKALREVHVLAEDIIRRLTDRGYFLGDTTSLMDRRQDLKKKCEKDQNSYNVLLKFMVAGACYPHYFKLSEIEEIEEMRDSNNFNPYTTVYFKGVPPHENFKYGKDLLFKMSKCGNVKRIYFDDTRMFFEFSPEMDHYNLFNTNTSLNEFKEVRKYNESAEILPSVLCALKAGRKKSSEASAMYAFLSDDFKPKMEKYSSRFYYIKIAKNFNKTKYPQKRSHTKRYQIQVEQVEDLITFWGVEMDVIEMRDEMSDYINQLFNKNQLFGFKGQIEQNKLVLAPYRDKNDASEKTTYHRALVISAHIDKDGQDRADRCYVKFVDYGNCEILSTAELKSVPTDLLPNLGRCIGDIPFLAVKYRLKGVSLKHNREIPERYPFYIYYGQTYWVDIYSTYSGEYVKVDLYSSADEVSIDKSYNYKLVNDANGYCEPLEENAADVRDNNVWSGRSSDSSGADSGRETLGQSPLDSTDPEGQISASSYDATVDKRWIELEDTSPDTGFVSSNSNNSYNRVQMDKANQPHKKGHKMQGPYNLFMTSISPLAQVQLRKCDVQSSSVNSIICNARPVTNTKKMLVGNEVSIVGTGSVQGRYFILCSIFFSGRR